MKNITTLVIHSEELSLKGKNRIFFEKILHKNLVSVVKFYGTARIHKEFGRFVIHVDDFDQDIIKVLADHLLYLPGIANLALAVQAKKEMSSFKDLIKKEIDFSNAKTFGIIAQRSDKTFPIKSVDCGRELGSFVMQNNPHLKVDLTNPEIPVHVEIGQKAAYIYIKKLQGVGGLPVGSAGSMVTLLSGGIDSPVASYLMNKRGAHNIFVHFKNATLESRSVEDKIEDLVNILSRYQGVSVLFIVPFADIQKAIIACIDSRYRMLVYRRFMFVIAERIAHQQKALGLVTGDSLAQVASQTLENLNVVHSVVKMFVATPLIGMNKREITDIATKIGTFETSILPYDDCCSMFIAKHPATRAKQEIVDELESKLDINSLIEETLSKIEKKVIIASYGNKSKI